MSEQKAWYQSVCHTDRVFDQASIKPNGDLDAN